MAERCRQRVQMQGRPLCLWTKQGIENVVHNLRRRSDNDDLVLQEGAVFVHDMPFFIGKNFPEFSWLICIERAEAKHMRLQVTRHVGSMSQFFQSPRRQ